MTKPLIFEGLCRDHDKNQYFSAGFCDANNSRPCCRPAIGARNFAAGYRLCCFSASPLNDLPSAELVPGSLAPFDEFDEPVESVEPLRDDCCFSDLPLNDLPSADVAPGALAPLEGFDEPVAPLPGVC